RALAEAVLGDHEDLLVVARDVHGQHLVARAGDVHAAHAAGVAAHRARVLLLEAHGQALLGDHQDLLARVDAAHGDELVVVADLYGADAVRPDRRVCTG